MTNRPQRPAPIRRLVRLNLPISALTCAVATVVAAGSSNRCVPSPTAIFLTNGEGQDALGGTVAMRLGADSFLLLGDISDDFVGDASGSVTMFRPDGSGWTPVSTFVAPQVGASDNFSQAMALGGDLLVVGAPHKSIQSEFSAGAASIFRYEPGDDRESWIVEAELTATVPDAGDMFGGAVDVDDEVDVAVVGAHARDELGLGIGAAYVFRKGPGGWSGEQKLLPTSPAPIASFGRAVSVEGDVIAVGAPGPSSAAGVGAVYLYRFDGAQWALEQKLDGPANGAQFGRIVRLDGDLLIVGAPLDDERATDAGAVHVFRFDGTTWNEQAKLTATEAVAEDRFGWSVGLDGSTMVVGAYVADGASVNSGAVHVFVAADEPRGPNGRRTEWTEVARLIDPDGHPFDGFGLDVAIQDGVLIAGAPAYDGAVGGAGGALQFDIACLVGPRPILGDLDGDGQVDGVDLGILMPSWGACGPAAPCPADFNDDGAVDGADLGILIGGWTG